MSGPKLGRPFVYQSEGERPVTISCRLPRELYDQFERQRKQRRTKRSEALFDAIRLWLDTPADPRDLVLSSDSNTVMPEVEEMIEAKVRQALAELHAANGQAVSEPTGSGVEEMKQCSKGHEPYPANKRECPTCHKERTARYRERQSTGTAQATV